MSITPIDSGVTVATLERRVRATYKRRRATMADYHEALAADWRSPSMKSQEAAEIALSAQRKAHRAWAAAREALDQARQVVAAA